MTGYFPELVAAVNTELPERCVIDGAIVVPDAKSRPLDFETLQLRIHTSASRVELLSAQTPARDTRSTAQPGMDFGDQTACTAANAARSTELRAASSAVACSWPACARSRQTYCRSLWLSRSSTPLSDARNHRQLPRWMRSRR